MDVFERLLSHVEGHQYLDDEHLSRLKDYRYRAVDLSPISKHALRHWWNFFAELMPPWLAPNAITLIGLGFVVFNVICVFVLMPDLEGPAPRWVYFSFAFGLFMYQTFDNIDGKQARKTGTSSPLGELFDHGIDSLNCVLEGIVQCASVGLGHSHKSAALLMLACWPMYLSTWEEYHTGVLYLGFINGPTEGLLIAVAVHLTSGICGPDIWTENARDTLPFLFRPFLPADAQLDDVFLFFVLMALIVGHAPFCVYNVHQALRRLPSRQGPTVALLDAMTELAPMFAFTGLSLTWVLSPYSCILDRELLIEWALMLCFVFGRMSTKTILAHLTKGSFPWFSSMLIPLALGCFLVNLPLLGLPQIFPPAFEVGYVYLSLILSFASYAQASNRVIQRFCYTLGISCLTIPHHQRLNRPASSVKQL